MMTEEERKARHREANKRYREANPEAVREQQKKYQQANKDELAAKRKAYREANREAIAAKKKEYYTANRETIAERRKEHYEATREEILAQKAEYYVKNRERKRAEREARKLAAIQKMGGCCADCKRVYPPFVYDFHHIDPTDKEHTPSYLLAQKDQDKIDAELAKCVLLCANCHRFRHHFTD